MGIKKLSKNQHGFGVIEILLVVVALGAIGFLAWRGLSQKDKATDDNSSAAQQEAATEIDTSVQWDWNGSDKWLAIKGTPPACPSPLEIDAPVDLSKVTSILYPGQTRGGNYKPHGGFRFDNNTDNSVTVTAPFDGMAVRGAQYLAEGEIQYTFDIIHPCGLMYRVGHLREIEPKFMALAEKFSAAVEGDSRTTRIDPPVLVRKGETIATKVGIISDHNTFLDWGVYDLRADNAASKNATFAAAHPGNERELVWHAVCWFDLLSSKNEALVRGLPPGDPTSGKTSAYCK